MQMLIELFGDGWTTLSGPCDAYRTLVFSFFLLISCYLVLYSADVGLWGFIVAKKMECLKISVWEKHLGEFLGLVWHNVLFLASARRQANLGNHESLTKGNYGYVWKLFFKILTYLCF